MISAVIKGTIIGAVITFVWGMFSWCFLPWHESVYHGFDNEEFVGWTIKENAKKAGVYIYPYFDHTLDKEAKKKAWEEISAKKKEGPIIFAAVAPKGGWHTMSPHLITQFLSLAIAACLISVLVFKSACSSYLGRVFFITCIAFIGGILYMIPFWNWWNFPTKYISVEFFDLVVGWFLAALVMAPFVKEPHPQG